MSGPPISNSTRFLNILKTLRDLILTFCDLCVTGFNPVAPSALKSTASLRSFRLPFPLAESQLSRDISYGNKGHQD